jgi:FK506-binding protein 4/5
MSDEEMKDVSSSDEETMKEEKESKNPDEEEKLTDDGGVKKKILQKGEGYARPKKGFEVKVHYVGKLLDGTQFDSSRDRNEPFTFKLGAGQVIKGWEKAVESMKKKEKALVTLSPDYGYGASGSPPKIPPNATLQFEIELLDWIEETDVSLKHDGSVMKKILQEGSDWEKPEEFSKATISYVLKTKDGSVLETKNNFQFVVGEEQVVRGIDEAVVSMKKGEKSLLTIQPSRLMLDGVRVFESVTEAVQCEIELISFEKEKSKWSMSFAEKLDLANRRKSEGNELFQKGKYERAIKKYKVVLDLFEYDSSLKDDEKPKANELKTQCSLNSAMAHFKVKDFKESLSLCEKVLKNEPRNLKALYRRGITLIELDRWYEAEKDLKKVLELDADNKDAKKALAHLKHLRQEQNKKDEKVFKKMFQHFGEQTSKPDSSQSDSPKETVETPKESQTKTESKTDPMEICNQQEPTLANSSNELKTMA